MNKPALSAHQIYEAMLCLAREEYEAEVAEARRIQKNAEANEKAKIDQARKWLASQGLSPASMPSTLRPHAKGASLAQVRAEMAGFDQNPLLSN